MDGSDGGCKESKKEVMAMDELESTLSGVCSSTMMHRSTHISHAALSVAVTSMHLHSNR